MEETDTIILENLRRIGCDIDESVNSLADFPSSLVVEGVVKCLKLIKPEINCLNHKLPQNLSAQYKVCMDIAKECENIGLRSQLGYETLLYGSQTDIRNLFIALIQKLPKSNEQPIPDNIDPFQQLLLSCKGAIQKELNKPWLPSFCTPKTILLPFKTCDLVLYNGDLSSLPRPRTIPTLIEKHLYDLAKEKYPYKLPVPGHIDKLKKSHALSNAPKLGEVPSRFSLVREFNFQQRAETNKKKPPLPPKPVHLGRTGQKQEEAARTHQEQCDEMRQAIKNLEGALDDRQRLLGELQEKSNNTLETINNFETELEERTREIDRMEKLSAMLEHAPEHLDRLEKLLTSNQEKMEDLKEKWEELKQPLEDEYEELNQRHRHGLRSELEELVDSLKGIVGEIQAKQEILQVLQDRVDSLPSSSLNRSFYTQRILSIVANVKKQNEEMNRVIEDVKQVQREINGLQGKIERTFAVTDEIIFTVAKNDETVKRIYKHFLTLHTECNDILRLIKETGSLTREIKDLENQVETECRKNTESRLKQALSGLEEIRRENQLLEEKHQNDIARAKKQTSQ